MARQLLFSFESPGSMIWEMVRDHEARAHMNDHHLHNWRWRSYLTLFHNWYSYFVALLQILPQVHFNILLVNNSAKISGEIVADRFSKRG